MKYSLLALVVCIGCGNKIDNVSEFPNEDGGVDAGPKVELICGEYSCGVVVDKNSGIVEDCGSCYSPSQCNDNDIQNQCGNACVPLTNNNVQLDGLYDTAGCNYWFGHAGWGLGYTELQFPGNCGYINANNCLYIINSVATNQPCSNDVCGQFWCCPSGPDAGVYALLPGAGDNAGSL